MVYNFKKIYAILAAVFVTTTGFAQESYGYSSSEAGDCCPQVCCDSSACCGQAFISADLLYWRAYEDGLDVCGSTESADFVNPGGGVISTSRAKTHDPHFDWSPGFRVGAGYQFASRCWDIAAYFTHFHTKAHRNGGEHKFHWKLDFDVLDVVLANNYDLGCFTIRPFAGLRAAYIDQKIRSHDANIAFLIADTAHNKQIFRGVGAVTGLEMNWDLGCGFGIYGNAAMSCLWGTFRVNSNESHTFRFGADFHKLRRHLDACQFVLDGGAGVSWRRCFWDNKQLVVRLGWEQHRYFNHNRFGTYGDLCLAGGVLSAGVEF